MAVARVDGTIIKETNPSDRPLIDFVWDQDARNVVYMRPDGVWSANASGSEMRQVASGPTHFWSLEGLDANGTVTLHHDQVGLHQRQASDSTPLPAPSVESLPTTAAATDPNNWAPYIHQVYDTPTELLNGGYQGSQSDGGKMDGCGPTSAVMVMTAIGRYAGFNVWVEPGRFGPVAARDKSVTDHWSPYGGFVSREYTANWTGSSGPKSFTFSDTDYYAGAKGALGYMVKSSVGTDFSKLQSFFSVQEIGYSVSYQPTQPWIKTHLDSGRLVIASHTSAKATFGHLSVIKGYVSDGAGNILQYIWNDSYGNQLRSDGWWGMYDGASVRYSPSYTTISTAWAIYPAR